MPQLKVPAFLRRLPQDLSRLAADNQRRIEQLERLASLLMLVLFLGSISPFLYKMATTSLWGDELYTIVHFSSKGLVTSLTDYHVPNNHILFNVLNSLVPGAESVQPYRARLWSFLSFAVSLGVMVGYFYRRRRYLEGAMCAVVVFNYGFLSLILQARGYGLAALFSTVATLAVVDYLRRPSAGALAALAAATVLGTWAIPVFVLYSGVLLVLLFLVTREYRVFIAGLVSLAAIHVLYLPVLGELLEHALTFAQEWGRQYRSFDAVSATIQTYLPLRGHGSAFLILTGTLLAPGLLTGRGSATGRATRLVAVAVVCFLALCLRLQTPLIRTTSFIVIPIAVVAVASVGAVLRQKRMAVSRPLAAAAALIVVGMSAYAKIHLFHFVPLENWKGTAETIERIFPDRLPLYCDFRCHYLAFYLREPHIVTEAFDEVEFQRGRQVYVDTGKDLSWKNELKQGARDHAAISIPQRYAEEMLILFYPPPRSLVRSVGVNGRTFGHGALTDRSRRTSWSAAELKPTPRKPRVALRVVLENLHPLRSAVVLWGDCPTPDGIRASIPAAGEPGRIAPARIHAFGDVLVVDLEDRPVEWFEIEADVDPERGSPCIDELWAYPSHRSYFRRPQTSTTEEPGSDRTK